MAVTYREAGVDIDAGDRLVDRIAPFAKATQIAEVLGGVGGFAGLCRVPDGLDEPVLVSGTDGVGTKLKLAFALDKHDTIGFDLVGMCVNDVLTCGARPLFFLDYFATAKLDVDRAADVIRGIAEACRECGAALLGGETAELPGMYHQGEYDLAGFSVGVVARKKIVDGKRVVPGDRVIGLVSSGLHSNGYSLARRVVDAAGGDLTARPTVLGGESLGEAMLRPTRLYARHVAAVLAAGIDVRAMSHITGGGLPGNLPRVLPDELGAKLVRSWPRAPIFDWLQTSGPIDESEMRRTFNCGIGYVFVVPPSDAEQTVACLTSLGETPIALGEIVRVAEGTEFEARVIYEGDG